MSILKSLLYSKSPSIFGQKTTSLARSLPDFHFPFLLSLIKVRVLDLAQFTGSLADEEEALTLLAHPINGFSDMTGDIVENSGYTIRECYNQVGMQSITMPLYLIQPTAQTNIT
ncbi:hypothetical protein ACJX0J_032211 [Zea mays]